MTSGNQRGPDRAQEQEDDQHDEQDRLADGAVDVLDRLGDEHRLVVGDLHLHAVGQRGGDARQHLVDGVRHFERIGRRLLDHAEGDGRLAVEADDTALIQGAKLGVADVGEPHEVAVGLLDDEIVELLRRAQIGLGEHGEFALQAFDPARGYLDILAAERELDVLRRQLVGGQSLRIEPDAHRVFAVAEQPHLGHAAQRLELVLHIAVGVVGDLERRMVFAGKGEIHDRLGVSLSFLNDRLVDLFRQTAAHASDPIAHVGSRVVLVAVELERDGDLARFLAADRGDEIDALDARERILEHLGDLGLDDRSTRSRIGRLDGDDRRVDRRVFAHAQPLIGDEANQHEHEAHHRGEDRPLDG